jgi:hypothetical protein
MTLSDIAGLDDERVRRDARRLWASLTMPTIGSAWQPTISQL